MEIVIEMFPVAFGVLLGLTWSRVGGPRAWRIAWAVSSVALGAFATLASGEWRVSPLYFLFDICVVAVVSGGAVLALVYWRRRQQRG